MNPQMRNYLATTLMAKGRATDALEKALSSSGSGSSSSNNRKRKRVELTGRAPSDTAAFCFEEAFKAITPCHEEEFPRIGWSFDEDEDDGKDNDIPGGSGNLALHCARHFLPDSHAQIPIKRISNAMKRSKSLKANLSNLGKGLLNTGHALPSSSLSRQVYKRVDHVTTWKATTTSQEARGKDLSVPQHGSVYPATCKTNFKSAMERATRLVQVDVQANSARNTDLNEFLESASLGLETWLASTTDAHYESLPTKELDQSAKADDPC